MDFCQENKLCIADTQYQQHPRRLYTWTSPGGMYRNQIDYIICKQRWKSSLQSAKTLPGADYGTDHELLTTRLKVKLKKNKAVQKPVKYNLNNIPEAYNVQVKNRFSILDHEERHPEELW